ncbi:IclR family transcriptional regulator domain-containing protein [Yoonia algicola]|uniref:IclR family transcriptional regulator C-terminal domain-containing protein n=1 Tax=Yoonia algicola TaxID=3137368 RepID=A0AAN0NGJ8_9RHOB
MAEVPKKKKTSAKAGGRSGLMTAAAEIDENLMDDAVSSRDYVSSLARGLEVLRAFNRTRRKMTLSEVATETGNTRAGARRILLTLVREGYAVADGRLFDLTPQVLELGFSVLSSKGAWDIARPFIEHLSADIRESVSAAVLDEYSVVYVSGTQFHRVISVGITVGRRFPAHATATGRVLLSSLPDEQWPEMLDAITLTRMTDRTVTDKKEFAKTLKKVREQGWALVDQELEEGLMSIAVPVYRTSDSIIGAINVGIPTLRMTPEGMVNEILPKLQATVQDISNALRR